MAYYEGEISPIYGNNCGYNNGWGGDGWWIILFALLFGWGGNGYGGFGGRGNGACATQADLAAGFANSEIMSDLNDLQLQSSQGFANVQQTLCQGFNGINTAILQGVNANERGFATTNYNMAINTNSITKEISDCCCQTQRLIERGFCDVINNQNAVGQRITDYLVNKDLADTKAENIALKSQIYQDCNTDKILAAVNRVPSPAYVVPNPYCNYGYTSNFNNNGCCGCNF